jgi:hypothetical protein
MIEAFVIFGPGKVFPSNKGGGTRQSIKVDIKGEAVQVWGDAGSFPDLKKGDRVLLQQKGNSYQLVEQIREGASTQKQSPPPTREEVEKFMSQQVNIYFAARAIALDAAKKADPSIGDDLKRVTSEELQKVATTTSIAVNRRFGFDSKR